MNRFLRCIAGLVLGLGIVATAFAAAPDGKSPATAIHLVTGTPVTGSLAGSGAGSYTYYTLNYPGDGSVGTLTLDFSPSDPTTANAFGLNVYQAGNTITSSNAVSSTPGTTAITFSSTTAGPVLVQVYNFNPGVTVSYRLTLTGVNQPTAAPAPSPTATPTPAALTGTAGGVGSPTNPVPLARSASGVLPGNPAGSFAYYTFEYPGDGSVQTLTLSYSPGGIDVGNAVTLNVYQNGQTLVSTNGGQASAPGQLSVSFSSTTRGPVLVQIGNYNLMNTINYTISR